uniref:Gelsolin-like domain-containing protein n=1 Tax=Phaeomonas parva TaxID=124430 RepID=A0A7S1U071_9STRA|mmetsp:Transcript_25705/g.80490  ORF Transcript_25705/g.80490 Transcript_25705/m.80490 type:complete len:104 (+) Transcript_25705:335-646(+)
MLPVGEGVLFKLSESTGELVFSEVARGDINEGMLQSGDVFVLDDGSEIFIWVGSEASSLESNKALATAEQYLVSNNKPAHMPIHLFKEGQTIRNARWRQIMQD